ncbi:Ubiquitin Carboxyl-Terminal Hydrolase 43 [Manis pentadactyla]|nr:Ubiquitin Carboxyl-Terminal Hydrolase 43 [Manis pentadactyla]
MKTKTTATCVPSSRIKEHQEPWFLQCALRLPPAPRGPALALTVRTLPEEHHYSAVPSFNTIKVADSSRPGIRAADEAQNSTLVWTLALLHRVTASYRIQQT